MAGMRFETSQGMKLGQTMGLSPKLIQSAEILQLNSMELQERLEQEVEKNVALEMVMPGSSDDGDPRREQHHNSANAEYRCDDAVPPHRLPQQDDGEVQREQRRDE